MSDTKIVSLSKHREKKVTQSEQIQDTGGVEFVPQQTVVTAIDKWVPLVCITPREDSEQFEIDLALEYDSMLPAPFSIRVMVVHSLFWGITPVNRIYEKDKQFEKIQNTSPPIQGPFQRHQANIIIKEPIPERWKKDEYILAVMIQTQDISARLSVSFNTFSVVPKEPETSDD